MGYISIFTFQTSSYNYKNKNKFSKIKLLSWIIWFSNTIISVNKRSSTTFMAMSIKNKIFLSNEVYRNLTIYESYSFNL